MSKVKTKQCIICGKKFTPRGGNQQRCGSYLLKTGCTWSNKVLLHKLANVRYRKTDKFRKTHRDWAREYARKRKAGV